MKTCLKLNGFFIFIIAFLVSNPQLIAHSEEVEQNRFTEPEITPQIEPDELLSRMDTADRDIASEPVDKTQVLEVNKKIIEKEVKQSRKELFYKCGKGREVRWIRLYYMKNGKCKTEYSREGNAKEVSMAHSYDTCESVLNNIKKNLETGGYSCEEKILMGALELN